MTRVAALLAVVALALAACGKDGAGLAPDDAAASPLGRWRLDREALLENLAKDFADEGPAAVAREQAQAREVNLELELLASGRYRVASLSLGIEQRTAGTWTQAGERLLFTPQQVDGRTVENLPVQEARFVRGRIEIDLDHKVFPLARH